MLQCSGELAAAVIGYLYTGRIKADASTAAEIISLANLWQLPGSDLAATHATAVVFTLSKFEKNAAISDTTLMLSNSIALQNPTYHPKCSVDAVLIDLVCQQLTAGPCQSFRRPTAPTDSVIADLPAMAAFSKAALDGGIEHDSVQTLYQVVLLSCVSWILHALVSYALCLHTCQVHFVQTFTSFLRPNFE